MRPDDDFWGDPADKQHWAAEAWMLVFAILVIALIAALAWVTLDDGRAEAADNLRLGASGPAVVQLQTDLTEAGWPVKADGRFGPRTHRTVRAFQRANGLRVDGVVGQQTLAALDRPATALAPAVRLNPPVVVATGLPPLPPASGPCAEYAGLLHYFSPGWSVSQMSNIMWRESRCNPAARNPSGASGLLQLMPLHIPNLGPCGVYSVADLLQADRNVCSAAIVYRRAGGSSPWAMTR